MHVVSKDSVVNNRFVFKINDIFTCKEIGPETSLVYIKGVKYAEIFGNHLKFNGYVSHETFTVPLLPFTPGERAT